MKQLRMLKMENNVSKNVSNKILISLLESYTNSWGNKVSGLGIIHLVHKHKFHFLTPDTHTCVYVPGVQKC